MEENGDVDFSILSIEISYELQSIMLLHGLPSSFDEPENLKFKIMDEYATPKQREQVVDDPDGKEK